jgi:hypothetical protein
MTRLSFVGRAIAVSALVPLLLAAGCGGEDPPAPATCDPIKILNDNCAACHSSTGTMGSLVLISADPAAALIGVQAKGSLASGAPACMGRGVLLEPTLPARGLFFDKFNDPPPCGDRMPSLLPPLPQADVNCLKTWATEEINKR